MRSVEGSTRNRSSSLRIPQRLIVKVVPYRRCLSVLTWIFFTFVTFHSFFLNYLHLYESCVFISVFNLKEMEALEAMRERGIKKSKKAICRLMSKREQIKLRRALDSTSKDSHWKLNWTVASLNCSFWGQWKGGRVLKEDVLWVYEAMLVLI